MELNSFKLEIVSKVALLSFNRPEKANSLEESDWLEMKQIFENLDNNPEVRVVVLSGEGKHFCAGMDLNTLMTFGQNVSDDPSRQRQGIRSFIVKIQDCISSIEKCRKPVIAAIHSGCIGGGVDIVTACDMRFSTVDAYFTIKEVDLGIVADIGTLQRLPTILNPGIVAELAFTGRKFFGKEAKDLGFVNQTFEDKEQLLAEVVGLAKQIAQKSPLVIRGIKETLLYKRDHNVIDSLSQIANYNSAMLLSADLFEAMQANLEKRKPVFQDS